VLAWPPLLASEGTAEVKLNIWLELWDLVDLVEEDVLADIEHEDDWDVDLVLLDVLLLSQASNTFGHSGAVSIVLVDCKLVVGRIVFL